MNTPTGIPAENTAIPMEGPVKPGVPQGPPANTATAPAPQKAEPPVVPQGIPNPVVTDPIDTNPTVPLPSTTEVPTKEPEPDVTSPALPMKPVVTVPEATPEVQAQANAGNGKINVVVHNTPVEPIKEEVKEVKKANNTLKPVFVENDIQKAPPTFSPMVPIEQTAEGKGLSNILVIGSEVIHVTHPGQRFRSQGGFNVLYIGSSEKELRDLYGIKTDSQLCAMQRSFGVRYMHQKPEIETSNPPCALQDKAIILDALQTRLKTLGHQLSIVPDNLVKARYLVQRKYLQDLVKKIESTPGDAKPCPVVERYDVNVQGPNLKELFSGLSKSSDCLQNIQLLQQLMMIMMLLLGSVSDKDIQTYLDQIPLEKILEIARSPKPSRNNLDVIQGAIDSLYMIYMKRQHNSSKAEENKKAPQENDTSKARIAELEAELETTRRQGNSSKQDQIDQLQAQLEEARRQLQEKTVDSMETEIGIEDFLPTTVNPELYRQVSEGRCGTAPAEVQEHPSDYFTKIEIIGDGACLFSSLYYAYVHHLSLKYPDNEEYRRIVQEARDKTQQTQGSKIPDEKLPQYFNILREIYAQNSDIPYCYGDMKIPFHEMYDIASSSDRPFPEYMTRSFTIEGGVPQEYGLAYVHGFMIALQSHYHIRVYTQREDGSYNLTYTTESNPIQNVKGYLNILQDPTEFSIPGEEMSNEDKANLRASGATNENIKQMSSEIRGSIDHYHALFPSSLEGIVEAGQAEEEEVLQIRNIYTQIRPLFEEAGMDGLVSATEITFGGLMDYINTYTGIVRAQGFGNGQQEEVDRLQRELEEARGQATQVGEAGKAKNTRIAELEQQLEEAQESLRSHIAKSSVGIMKQAQQDKKLTAKNAEIEGLRQQLAEAEGRVTQAGTNSSAKNTRIADLERQLEEARGQATQAGTNSSAKNSRIADLERQLEEARGQATQVGEAGQAKNTRITELQEQLNKAQEDSRSQGNVKNTEIEGLRRQLAEAEGRVTQSDEAGQAKNSQITDLTSQLETARQTITELQNQTPTFDPVHLEQILGVLLTDGDLRTRANSYIEGRENTNLLADLGIVTQEKDQEICKIYSALQQMIYTQERFFYTPNDKTYNLDGDIFQDYFNTVPTYDTKDLLKELVTLIRDILSLRVGSVVKTNNMPILHTIINSKIKTSKTVQYNGLMTEFKTLYNKHKFMGSSIKVSGEPNKLQIESIEPSTTNNYVSGMIFYIRFVQLTKQFIDSGLAEKCGIAEEIIRPANTARVPSPRSASPPPRSRSPSPGQTANPYIGKKSDAELYRR